MKRYGGYTEQVRLSSNCSNLHREVPGLDLNQDTDYPIGLLVMYLPPFRRISGQYTEIRYDDFVLNPYQFNEREHSSHIIQR
jgi:hypothetical protein